VRRRILLAIVGVTALAVIGFGIPLGLAVRRIKLDDARTTLQREAARAALDAPAPLGAGDPLELSQPQTDDVRLAVYRSDGALVAGDGPARVDRVSQGALRGRLSSGTVDGVLVVGWPLVANEETYGVLRAALPQSSVEREIRIAWALMAALGGLVIAGAALLARRQAARLARPIGALSDAAARLGDGDFTVDVATSGISEVDRAGAALTATAARLGRLVARERSFSSDASHQLRTPLTGLRLALETAAAGQRDAHDAIDEAITAIDRLEATVDDLLRLARTERPDGDLIELEPVLTEAERRWHGPYAAAGRRLQVVSDTRARGAISAAALGQILDVLLANALEHGAGTVAIQAASSAAGVAIDVTDEGTGIADGERAFERGAGEGTGIGLALARSLAEAEGARLTLRDVDGGGASFRLLLTS
jgi:signal transduction histidine kinase